MKTLGHRIFFYSFKKLKILILQSRIRTEKKGKLSWHDWTKCTKTCDGGIQIRLANDCVPSYAVCRDLQVKQRPCNEEACFYGPHSETPPGTIVSWIPKPNKNFATNLPIPDKWILCDGIQRCQTGIFTNETCSDLSNRALIGTGTIIFIKVIFRLN